MKAWTSVQLHIRFTGWNFRKYLVVNHALLLNAWAIITEQGMLKNQDLLWCTSTTLCLRVVRFSKIYSWQTIITMWILNGIKNAMVLCALRSLQAAAIIVAALKWPLRHNLRKACQAFGCQTFIYGSSQQLFHDYFSCHCGVFKTCVCFVSMPLKRKAATVRWKTSYVRGDIRTPGSNWTWSRQGKGGRGIAEIRSRLPYLQFSEVKNCDESGELGAGIKLKR